MPTKAELEEQLFTITRAWELARQEHRQTVVELRETRMQLGIAAQQQKNAETALAAATKKYEDLAGTVGALMGKPGVVRPEVLAESLVVGVQVANKQRDDALAAAQAENDIRRRVHARFKQVRRDALLAADRIQRLELEGARLKSAAQHEKSLGEQARRFAALAYKVLGVEDTEKISGKAVLWP